MALKYTRYPASPRKISTKKTDTNVYSLFLARRLLEAARSVANLLSCSDSL